MKARITTLIFLLLASIANVWAEEYQLWIDNTKVNTTNCSDIMGDGHFCYIPSKTTLCIRGGITSSVSCIYTNIKNLIINVEKDATFNYTGTNNDAINIFANTKITGNGKLTINSSKAAIKVDTYISLTIEDANMNFTGSSGIHSMNTNYGSQNLTIINSNLQVSSTSGAIYGFGGGITLENSYITAPQGGTVSGNEIVDQDGNRATNITIRSSASLGSGTLDDPYDVAGACAAVKDLTWTSNTVYETTGEVYVKGKISRIANNGTFYQSGTFGNASFYIKDEEGDAEFFCFRILYLGNRKYESGQDIKEGDEVIVCGKLMNYKGKTPETVAGLAYLYSLNGICSRGTQDDPYNVAAACQAVKDLTWTSNTEYETTGEVYVRGIISRILTNGAFSQSGTYGNASFYIKDEEGDAEFFCFRILYLGNRKYESGQDIKEGDEVIVCGKLMNYKGKTPETVAGLAYLYSLNGICSRGTQDDPYNVAAACQAVKDLTWTSNTEYETTGEVYVRGIISRILTNGAFSQSGTYGNASFYIKDEEGDAEFFCFRILYLGNRKYESGQDIKEGDEVIVCGKLMNYKGKTPETVAGLAYLYSLNGDNGGYSLIATGVNDIIGETITNNQYYSLDGLRFEGKPTHKGIYIYKGKKVIVK